MKGFVVYPTYRIENNKAFVWLFGRLENGESFLTINGFKPYFFVKTSDQKKLPKGSYSIEETKLKDFEENSVIKIITNTPKEVPDLRKQFEDLDIKCYEADVRFSYRFLMENEIKSGVEITGEYEKGEFVDRIYKEPNLSPIEFVPELKVLSLDIETEPNGEKLYSISLYGKDYKKAFLLNKKSENAECFDDEKILLESFRKEVIKFDPDIITGWNLIDFDLKYLEERFKQRKIPFVLGRTNDKCSLRIETNFIIDSKADFPGRAVLDGIQLLKTSFVKLEDYKLGTAAAEFLGEKKLIGEKNKAEEIINLYENRPKELIEYNIKDAKLVYDILEKTNVLALTIRRSLLTGMQLDRVKATIASFDFVYIIECRKKKLVVPSISNFDRTERIKGGFVMQSKPGIYDHILVLDFKSLYPSLIITFNIDPYAYAIAKYKKDVIETPNEVKFSREIGILPEIISHLWRQRDKAKKEKNQLESNAIKILMNSFFGALANPTCRFYSLDMANAITKTGQHLIQTVMKEVENIGYEVIYGDTDSIFVKSNAKNYEEAEQIGKKIQDTVNKFLEQHIKEKYNVKSYMELQFEKIFVKFFMPTVRKSEAGSKKRYAGLLIKDGKEKMSFTGMEFVRRDWTEAAKVFQLAILERVFHNQDVDSYIKEFVSDLKQGKYDDLLIYKKAMSKGIEEYTETTPPHIKAAMKMGKIKSNIIEYIMTLDGPEPIDERKSKIDYDHYIEKQLKPLADSLLQVLNKKFDEIISGKKQKSLFEY